MNETLELFWAALAAAGGSLALALIISLALGIGAMTLLFVGSAVVTLVQFARVVRSARTLIGSALLWAGLVALLRASAAPAAEGAPATAFAGGLQGAGAAALATLLSIAFCRLLLARVHAARLGLLAVLLLGAGSGALLGASGRMVYALAPAGVAAALAAQLFALRRRARPAPAAGEVERLSTGLALALFAGGAVAWLAGDAGPRIASGGAGLLVGVVGLALLGLVPLAAAGLVDSRRNVEWFIAVRYLLAKRRQTFISIITGICVIGIAAGVWLIVTVLSVMNGFERVWRDEIIGNRAHLSVQSGLGPFPDYASVLATIERVPGVVAASPFLDAEGMVRGGAGEIFGVRVRGIDPARVGRVTDLRDDLREGRLEDLVQPGDDSFPGIVIGSELANVLGVGLGEEITVISPFGGPQTPLGPAPRLARFRVVGVFQSSFFQYDEVYTYVSLAAAQDFKRSADVIDGIEVRTPDFYRSQAVGRAIREALGFPYFVRDWKEFFPAFFQALKSERIMMFVLLTMIMVVAAFSIVSTLVMMIMEKESDIAILKTMGAEDDAIERIFALQGTLIGLVGVAIGVVAAVSVTSRIAWIQQQIEAITGIDTLPASVYQFHTLPAELNALQVAVAVGLAMVLSLGATLLPSRQAARLDPVEALRHE